MSINAYSQYQQQSVLTANGPTLIVYLFDRMIKSARLLKAAFEQNDLSEIHTNCCKIQDILSHLVGTLDRSTHESKEISDELEKLYNFYYQIAVDMNMTKQSDALPQLTQFLEEWRTVWFKISKDYSRK